MKRALPKTGEYIIYDGLPLVVTAIHSQRRLTAVSPDGRILTINIPVSKCTIPEQDN